MIILKFLLNIFNFRSSSESQNNFVIVKPINLLDMKKLLFSYGIGDGSSGC